MTISKKLAFVMAAMILLVSVMGAAPRMTNAASKANALSFTTNNTGIEIGKTESITFTATLDTFGISDLYVTDESGNNVANLRETSQGIYEATVKVTANEKGTHTYKLNTSDPKAFTCDINFYAPLTAEDTMRDELTWQSVKAISHDITEANSKAVLSGIFRTLENDANVEKVWYETDRIINFRTVDGVGNVFDADLMISKNEHKVTKTSQESDAIIKSISEKYANETKGEHETKASDCIGSKNICILAPYYGVEDQFTERYIQEAEYIHNTLGGGTITAFYGNGELTGKKADISAFKNLDSYGIILVDSHGSLYGNQNLICVEYTSGQTSADFSAGRLVKGPDYVGVLAPFIKYYTKSLPSTLVYFGQCYGMHSSHLSDAFKSLGAEFVTGFSMSVSTLFDGRIFSEYFKYLERINDDTGAYYTVKQAYDAAIARHGSTDPFGSERAVWKYSGNTKLVIKVEHAQIPITSVTITPAEAEIGVGETLSLKLNIEPAAAAEYAVVRFESFNEDIAEVNATTGVVTGMMAGTTTIACEVKDEFGTALAASMRVKVKAGTFTVKFVDGITGDVISTQQVQSGKSAQAPEAPKHDGYVFTGWDTDFSNVKANITVTALYFAIGDVNSDGSINTGDATAVLKNAAGLITFSDAQKALADFNNDGAVNTADATALLKYCAK